MKKSDDLANAFLLKHYPGRRRLSASVPSEVSSRNRSLIAITALVIAVATSVILVQRFHSSLQEEKRARAEAEQHLFFANLELGRVQKIKESSAAQTAELARAVQEISGTADGAQKEFLNLLVPEALRAQVNQGVPASLLIAVAIKESNYGQSEGSRNANNPFSLKASDGAWSGQTWISTTKEKNKKIETVYRLYPDLSSSVHDYAALLQSRMQKQDPSSGQTSWLEMTTASQGPADPAWQTSIQALIDKHQLQKLDNPMSLANGSSPAKSEMANGQQASPPWVKVE